MKDQTLFWEPLTLCGQQAAISELVMGVTGESKQDIRTCRQDRLCLSDSSWGSCMGNGLRIQDRNQGGKRSLT